MSDRSTSQEAPLERGGIGSESGTAWYDYNGNIPARQSRPHEQARQAQAQVPQAQEHGDYTRERLGAAEEATQVKLVYGDRFAAMAQAKYGNASRAVVEAIYEANGLTPQVVQHDGRSHVKEPIYYAGKTYVLPPASQLAELEQKYQGRMAQVPGYQEAEERHEHHRPADQRQAVPAQTAERQVQGPAAIQQAIPQEYVQQAPPPGYYGQQAGYYGPQPGYGRRENPMANILPGIINTIFGAIAGHGRYNHGGFPFFGAGAFMGGGQGYYYPPQQAWAPRYEYAPQASAYGPTNYNDGQSYSEPPGAYQPVYEQPAYVAPQPMYQPYAYVDPRYRYGYYPHRRGNALGNILGGVLSGIMG